MDRRWSREATSFGQSVRTMLERLGSVDFARRAEVDPAVRRQELAPLLAKLGFEEVDIFGDRVDAEIAAAAARAAGTAVMPWPVSARLAVPEAVGDRSDAVYLSLGRVPRRLEHVDVSERPLAIDLRTLEQRRLVVAGPIRAMPLDPFGVDVATPTSTADAPVVPLDVARRMLDAHIILTAFYVLGALDTVMHLTAGYSAERVQFGQPIVRFGAVQWRLSDVMLAKTGFAELSAYTLSHFAAGTLTPADSVALRFVTLDAANTVLANAHQIFGAIGLCEEHDLTLIDRHVQSLLRRPSGVAATSELLRDEIAAHGFDGVFPIPALKPALAGSSS